MSAKMSEVKETGCLLIHVSTTLITTDCGHAHECGCVSTFSRSVPLAIKSSEMNPFKSADH